MTLRVPWDVFELIIKSASSTALALFARTCHDIAEIALEELARRPHLFDLRNDDSGIESFFGSRVSTHTSSGYLSSAFSDSMG